MFKGSPIKRTGRDRFLRNVLIAAGNSGDARMLDGVVRQLGDESPLVRGMAVWALKQLADDEQWNREKARLGSKETDGDVKSEWAAG